MTQQLMSLADVAQHCGVKPHEVQDWIASGSLAHIVLPKCVRVTPEDLADFLARNRVKSWAPAETATIIPLPLP